jgi:hypothetical protein
MPQVIRDPRYADRSERVVIDESHPSGGTLAARVVNIITGIILTLLAARFIFALLGANRDSAIGGFVYSSTEPLVAPFFSLFNYQTNFGIASFEFQTLVAMLFYAFLGWLLIRLFTIGDDHDVQRL